MINRVRVNPCCRWQDGGPPWVNPIFLTLIRIRTRTRIYTLFDIMRSFLVVVCRMLALLAALCDIFDRTAKLVPGCFAFWPSVYYY